MNVGGVWAPEQPRPPYQGMHVSTMCPVQMVLASVYPERYPNFVSAGVEKLGNLCRDLFVHDVLNSMYSNSLTEVPIPWGGNRNRGHIDIVSDRTAPLANPLFGVGRVGFEVKSTTTLKKPAGDHVEQSLRYMHIAEVYGVPFDYFWIILVDKADIARSTAWPVTLTREDSTRIGELLAWADTTKQLIVEGHEPEESELLTRCVCARCFKEAPKTNDEVFDRMASALLLDGQLDAEAKNQIRIYAAGVLESGQSLRSDTGWTVSKGRTGMVTIRYREPSETVLGAEHESA